MASFVKGLLAMSDVREQVLAALKAKFELLGDGHHYFHPDRYIEMGLPKEFVMEYHKVHLFQQGNPKGPLADTEGVDNLEILYGIAKVLGANTEEANRFIGRGKQARALVRAIKEYVNEHIA